MLRVVKVRLYPNKAQKQLIHKTFGSCRFVYNILLDAKIKAYECGDNLSSYELKKRLVPMKKAEIGSNNGKSIGIDVGVKVFDLTKKLSENQTIAVENLMIKNMSKKAKGSIENPNMRTSSKSGLNRSILQQSWGKFFELLEYKLKRNGGELIRVDPKFTSQKCSCCGYISKENRESQAKFICKECGYSINADYNASLNILNAAGTDAKAS